MSARPKPVASVRGFAPAPPPADKVAAFLAGGAAQVAGATPSYPEVAAATSAPARKPMSELGTAAHVTRKSGRVRRKTMIYFAPDTFDELHALHLREGREMSAIVDEAVRAYLARRAK